MKNTSPAKTILLSLGIVFVLLLAYFTPFSLPLKQTLFPFAAALGLVFLALGITLTVMAGKEKGRMKTFLMLTGISAMAPFVFSILHNLFYGMAATFEHLACIFEPLHAACFIIALIAAPITFIVGMTGSIVLLKKEGTPASAAWRK